VCELTYDDGEMSIEDLVDDKELVIVMTQAQYVKAVSADSFKTQGRGGRGVSGGKLKADDIVRHVIFTTAHAHLLFFSNRGKVYRLRALEIPERERTAKGMPIVNLLPLQADEQIQAIIDTRDFAGERFLFFATKQGHRQEDGVRRLRLEPPRRPHRHQPARRRRAGARDRDRRQRRHLHGQPQAA
jgi:DNA gyrase subunit A